MSTKTKAAMETANIGLADEARNTVSESLNGLLSDLMVLYTKARNYHWNVTGDQFFTLHQEFEKLYDGLAEDIDEVAERVRALDGTAFGTMAQFLEHASLREASGTPDAKAMVKDLAGDYEATVSKLRKMVEEIGETGDAGTEDFCTGLMESYEKTAWMLRSYLR